MPRTPILDPTYATNATPEVEYNRGIHLTDSVLWFDSDRRTGFIFVSHGHVDEVARGRRMVATNLTLRLLSPRGGKFDALTALYRHPFSMGLLRLELIPAGHLPGAAQVKVTRREKTIVYTGDINTRESRTCPAAPAVPCDVLVLEATYGDPRFRFPPREEVEAGIIGFVEQALADRQVPVLLAQALGPAQEVATLLEAHGHPSRVHSSIHQYLRIYRDAGIPLAATRRFSGRLKRGEVLILPPILRNAAAVRELGERRVALVSGRAVEPEVLAAMNVSAGFPLSSHADYDDLVDYVRTARPRQVYTVRGYPDVLAAALRREGFNARPLQPPRQLPLFRGL